MAVAVTMAMATVAMTMARMVMEQDQTKQVAGETDAANNKNQLGVCHVYKREIECNQYERQKKLSQPWKG